MTVRVSFLLSGVAWTAGRLFHTPEWFFKKLSWYRQRRRLASDGHMVDYFRRYPGRVPLPDKVQILGPWYIGLSPYVSLCAIMVVASAGLVSIYKNNIDRSSYCGVKMPVISHFNQYLNEKVTLTGNRWMFLVPTNLLTEEERDRFLVKCACSIDSEFPKMNSFRQEVFILAVFITFKKTQTAMYGVLMKGTNLLAWVVLLPVVRTLVQEVLAQYTPLPTGLIITILVVIGSSAVSRVAFQSLSWVVGTGLVINLTIINQVIVGFKRGWSQYKGKH